MPFGTKNDSYLTHKKAAFRALKAAVLFYVGIEKSVIRLGFLSILLEKFILHIGRYKFIGCKLHGES